MIENTLLEQDNRRRRWLRTSAGLAAIIAVSAATGWGVASLAAPAAAPDTAKVREALNIDPSSDIRELNGVPQVLGPAPCAISRVKKQHRYHFMVKAARGFAIGPLVRQTLKSIRPPSGVSVAVDVDPMSLA